MTEQSPVYSPLRSRLDRIPAIDADGSVHIVVETPKGSTSKFKYDSTLGAMTLSRPLPSGLAYPNDWGFIPSTLGADQDPLDALVVWEGTSYPGVVLRCRILGALRVEQAEAGPAGGRERNDRLITAPLKSVMMQSVVSLDDLGERRRAELEQFFTAAVAFESKDLKILGWAGREEAESLLLSATKRQRP